MVKNFAQMSIYSAKGVMGMDMSSIMASQLRSLQSTIQMSVLNNALNMGTVAATEMLESLPNYAAAAHPHKGASIDVKA